LISPKFLEQNERAINVHVHLAQGLYLFLKSMGHECSAK